MTEPRNDGPCRSRRLRALLILFGWLTPPAVIAQDAASLPTATHGTVSAVDGSTVEIELEVDGGQVTRRGDQVRIVYDLPDSGIAAHVASGDVVAVNRDTVSAVIRSGTSAVRPGFRAVMVPSVPLQNPFAALEGQVVTSDGGPVWTGLSVRDVTKLVAKQAGMTEPRGVVIDDIVPGSPAAQSDLREGDVIVGIFGSSVANIQDFPQQVAQSPPGSEIELEVVRDGESDSVSVTAAPVPQDSVMQAMVVALAEEGNRWAQGELGKSYLAGDGVEGDLPRAFEWLSKSAEQGSPYPMYLVGQMYYLGSGVEREDAQAVKWLHQAALAGITNAQYDMAVLIYQGRGVEKNYGSAMGWMRLAAEAGDPRAENFVGTMYELGQGVEEDLSEAVRWYHAAAKQDFAAAQYNMGRMCLRGRGVRQDDKVAFAWITLAARQGIAAAQNDLGWMYQNGRGVRKNRVQAIAWYLQSARQGHEQAAQSLAAMGIPR